MWKSWGFFFFQLIGQGRRFKFFNIVKFTINVLIYSIRSPPSNLRPLMLPLDAKGMTRFWEGESPRLNRESAGFMSEQRQSQKCPKPRQGKAQGSAEDSNALS